MRQSEIEVKHYNKKKEEIDILSRENQAQLEKTVLKVIKTVMKG